MCRSVDASTGCAGMVAEDLCGSARLGRLGSVTSRLDSFSFCLHVFDDLGFLDFFAFEFLF